LFRSGARKLNSPYVKQDKFMSISSTSAAQQFMKGCQFQQQQRPLEALLAYHTAWKLAPDVFEYSLALGSCLEEIEEPSAAMESLHGSGNADLACLLGEYYLEHHPPCLKIVALLGDILSNAGSYDQAVQYYQQAADLCPENPIFQHNIGVCLQKDNRHREAIAYLNRALVSHPEWVSARKTLATCFIHTRKFCEAIDQLERVYAIEPSDATAALFLADLYANQGATQQALSHYDRLEHLGVRDYGFLLRSRLLLPIVYKHSEEMDTWYTRFGLGLRKLLEVVDSGDVSTVLGIYEALLHDNSTFFIAYQGRNCRDYMQTYGQIIAKVLAARHPDIARNALPTVPRSNKIHIGLVTCRIDQHPLTRWLQGWLKNRNQEDFIVHLYLGSHSGSTSDLKSLVDHWTDLPGDLEGAAQQIQQDQLDVLVFSDIGMLPWLTLLAGFRLAPVQCTCWAGHPVTTGLQTMDYFLSSELQEPEGAEEQYTEKLIRLPGIGVVCTQSQLPESPHPRSHHGIADEDIVYLCAQSLYKYLPEDDHIFVEIARQVSNARFLFIDISNRKATEDFLYRLQLVFEEAGLVFDRYVIMSPRQDQQSWADYISLPMNSDIFLDSIGWSGGLTTMDAVACSLPIVTCPTSLMRGRHSFGILKHIGVTETIAANKAEYVELAVRLGLDQQWRSEIAQKIRMGRPRLSGDLTCIKKMEDFFRSVARKR
jgi:protein O-GlcNAc transferase